MKEKKSILAVDDNPHFLELLRYNLAKDNIEVKSRRTKYFDPEEVDTSSIQLVVSDFYLPGTNGIDLCKQLKCGTEGSYPLFILLAHEFDEVNFKEAVESGVDDFFTKPVRIMSLIKRIKTLIKVGCKEKNVSCCEDDLSLVENVTIDNQAYKVYIENEHVDLNQIEFSLFKLFVCNPGKLFTYGQLYLELNAFGFILGIYSIKQQVELLRKKLDKFSFNFDYVDEVGFKLDVA